MPNYEYLCSLCNSLKEVYRTFEEADKHPVCCTHEMKRVYQPTGVIFKGKGFYKTGG